MRREYAPDKFTENEVLAELDAAGLRHGRGGGRYILSQCPLHEDSNPSCQIYTDDWFVKCHAGCEGGRFHITKAFPQLRQERGSDMPREQRPTRSPKKASPVKYKSFNLMDKWKSLPEIPADHVFKNIPIDVLNSLGWRWDATGNRYFIPYFSRSKKTIPFAQWRNLKGNVRFNFWKDAKPTLYGTWNLEPGNPIFLVEGASDAAALDFAAIPWIAAPSAASGELVKAMAKWCAENDVNLVYAGDNDSAGDKLKDALDQVCAYRVKQPREPYKDWCDMLEAEGVESVQDYCMAELIPPEYTPTPWKEKTPIEKVQEVFPGATKLKTVDSAEKKQLETAETTTLF